MNESTRPNSEVGIFIHEISIRNGNQAVALETIDVDEVLAQSELQLSGSISGKLPEKVRIVLVQTFGGFFKKHRLETEVQTIQRGRFRTDVKLRNGINGIKVCAVGTDDVVLDEKNFDLH